MGYSEIYTGMQQGVVDGAENNVTALRDHADVTKYYCFDEHTRIPDILLISSETWNAMSDHQRQIMTDCAKKMTEDYKSAWTEFENEVLAAAEEKGVELIRDVDTPLSRKPASPSTPTWRPNPPKSTPMWNASSGGLMPLPLWTGGRAAMAATRSVCCERS